MDEHPYPIFVEIDDIDHSKTKVKYPQTNAIFHSILCPDPEERGEKGNPAVDDGSTATGVEENEAVARRNPLKAATSPRWRNSSV